MDLSHSGATETSPLAWILLHSQKFLSVQAMMIALLLKLKTQVIQFHLSLKAKVSTCNLFQLITIYVDTVNFVVHNYFNMALNLLRVLIWQIGNILGESCIFLLEIKLCDFQQISYHTLLLFEHSI